MSSSLVKIKDHLPLAVIVTFVVVEVVPERVMQHQLPLPAEFVAADASSLFSVWAARLPDSASSSNNSTFFCVFIQKFIVSKV